MKYIVKIVSYSVGQYRICEETPPYKPLVSTRFNLMAEATKICELINKGEDKKEILYNGGESLIDAIKLLSAKVDALASLLQNNLKNK